MRRDALTWYLEAALAGSVEVRALRPLGTDGPTTDPSKSGARGTSDPKAFGYGRPIQIDLLLDGVPRSYVLSTMRVGSGFGHDHFADRAGALIWAHDAYGRLPRHVRSLDVGFITREGELRSAGRAEEFFLLMEKVEGFLKYFRVGRRKCLWAWIGEAIGPGRKGDENALEPGGAVCRGRGGQAKSVVPVSTAGQTDSPVRDRGLLLGLT